MNQKIIYMNFLIPLQFIKWKLQKTIKTKCIFGKTVDCKEN